MLTRDKKSISRGMGRTTLTVIQNPLVTARSYREEALCQWSTIDIAMALGGVTTW